MYFIIIVYYYTPAKNIIIREEVYITCERLRHFLVSKLEKTNKMVGEKDTFI